MNRTSGNSTGQVILDFHIARSWEKSFIFYDRDENDNDTPHDVTTSSWEFFILRYPGDRVKQLSVTGSPEITFPAYLDNEIHISLSATDTDLEEGKYYFELYNSTEQRTYVSQDCEFSFKGPAANPAQADVEVYILDGSIEVQLISTSGGISSVVTDGVTITGDGTTSNPLVAVGVSGALLSANNLSDVASVQTSRNNIEAEHNQFTVTDKSTSFNLVAADLAAVKRLFRCTANLTVTLDQDSTSGLSTNLTAYFEAMTGVTVTFAFGSGASGESTSGGMTLVGSSSGSAVGSVSRRAANTYLIINGSPAVRLFSEYTLAALTLTFTNMSGSAQELAAGSTGRYRTKVDLTGMTAIRCGVSFSAAGASTAGFYLEYSTDQSSWTTLGTASGSDLASIAGTVGFNVSNWITISGLGEVWLRSIGIGGDGAADPVVGRVVVQVKNY